MTKPNPLKDGDGKPWTTSRRTQDAGLPITQVVQHEIVEQRHRIGGLGHFNRCLWKWWW